MITLTKMTSYWFLFGISSFIVFHTGLLQQWFSPAADLTWQTYVTRFAIFAFVATIGLWFFVAVESTLRFVLTIRYWIRPAILIQAFGDLNSSADRRQRRALQTIGEVYGHPFGLVECWPFLNCTKRQIASLLIVYKRLGVVCPNPKAFDGSVELFEASSHDG